MQRVYLLFLLIVLIGRNDLCGQVVLTTDRFPSPGDVLISARADTGTEVQLGIASEKPQLWDFTGLTSSGIVIDSFLVPNPLDTNNVFPAANLWWRPADGADQYLFADEQEVVSLGYTLDLFGQVFPVVYSQPLTLLRAPTALGDSVISGTTANFAIALDDYPFLDSLLSAFDLGELGSGLDSLRLVTSLNVIQRADAWGTCRLPLADYDVLRLVEESFVEAALEVFVAFGPIGFWLDLGDFIEGLELAPLATGRVYSYLSPTHQVPITQVATTPDGTVTSIDYLLEEETTSTTTVPRTAEWNVYPNPTQGVINLMNRNVQGVRQIAIYSARGQLVRTVSVDLIDGTCSIDLKGVKDGLYYFRIEGDGSQPVWAGKIMVNN